MKNKYKFDNTGYGPLLDTLQDELSPYIIFSEKAYRIIIERFSKKSHLLLNKNNKIMHLLLSNAKNTSFSIRALSTLAQPIEAYALLRIRLEQLIISSYLIHEEQEKGITSFKNFYPVIEYNLAATINKNENLKRAISLAFPEYVHLLDEKIKSIFKRMEESYDFQDDIYKRKWTNLKINQLAERRDKLIDSHDVISQFKLLDYYNTVYKIASSIVHSDVASISENFITLNDSNVVVPQELYVFTNIITLVHFDIIQCYEVAKYFKLDLTDEYLGLYKKYQSKIKNDFELRL